MTGGGEDLTRLVSNSFRTTPRGGATAYIKARAGEWDEVRVLLRRYEERQPQGPNAYLLTSVDMALGETGAYQLIEAGIQERNQAAGQQLPWDPVWDPIRGDQRFRGRLVEMGL